MKIKHLFWLFILLLLVFRCNESERGQYLIDSVPPGEIKLLRVENLEGESIIHYEIPDDDDLLYVKASYTRDNGVETEQKVSAYSRNIKIEGINRTHELDVELVAVDRSRNESLPVTVKVFPLDSPIHSTLASLMLAEDFGGIRIVWDNPTGKEMVICVDSPNEAGEMVNTKNFYINSLTGTGNVRGFDSEERLFNIYIRDRWGNHSDTISRVFTPLFEEELKEGMRRWNPPGIPYTAYAHYHIENIWDGNINSFFIVQTKGEFPFSFTFDLGKKIKFSRVKQVQRQGAALIYTSQNIQYFQLWGTNSPGEVSDSFEKWIKLGDFEMIKPSGLPPGENSPEDIAVAAEGHDFNIDPNAPAVRYIRYVIVATWSGDANASMSELRFFGSIEK